MLNCLRRRPVQILFTLTLVWLTLAISSFLCFGYTQIVESQTKLLISVHAWAYFGVITGVIGLFFWGHISTDGRTSLRFNVFVVISLAAAAVNLFDSLVIAGSEITIRTGLLGRNVTSLELTDVKKFG